jgi:hypothetical protein|tara:strand:- start:9658 stop:11244 length:1587 start_codon:yes stop_codon:yes gene_type:complete
MLEKLIDSVMKARMVGTPLIAIETPDQGATSKALFKAVADRAEAKEAPVPFMFCWDSAQGIRPINEQSKSALAEMLEPVGGDIEMTINPALAINVLRTAPATTFVVASNLNRFWEDNRLDPQVVQAIWNLRDQFKTSGRTFVMTMPDCSLPSELRHDVVVFTEDLPTAEEIAPVVRKLHKSASLSDPSDETVEKATHLLSGLALQQAEQACAMSLSKDADGGLDMDMLRTQQRQQIEQTPGLEIWDGDTTFDDIKGLDALTGYLRKVIGAKTKTRAFVFIDEIEKMIAGATGQGDSSGTSQEQLAYFLNHMQKTNARGILLVGPAGTGKSEIGKAAGNEADCWTVSCDVGAMKGSLVGETGNMTRRALRVVESLAQGEAFWIATCNSIDSLPPELRRRFSYGTWFVDLPSDAGRKAIWKHYCKKFNLKASGASKFNHEGWTGAEIKTCASMANDMDIDLKEASKFISPVSRSSAETIRRLQTLATGRFMSAEKGGFYKAPEAKSIVDASDVTPVMSLNAERIMEMDES